MGHMTKNSIFLFEKKIRAFLLEKIETLPPLCPFDRGRIR
jgi:hypothetical protein